MDKIKFLEFVGEALDKEDNVLLITMSEQDITVVANFDREHIGDFILSLATAFGGGEETLH